jgi:hypothetical protein
VHAQAGAHAQVKDVSDATATRTQGSPATFDICLKRRILLFFLVY